MFPFKTMNPPPEVKEKSFPFLKLVFHRASRTFAVEKKREHFLGVPLKNSTRKMIKTQEEKERGKEK